MQKFQDFGVKSAQRHLVILVLICVLGFVLRSVNLDLPIWYDEAYTIEKSKQPFLPLIRDISQAGASPPLFYLILKPWMAVFGDSVSSVRWPSILFGMGCIPLTYLVGRAVFTKSVALGAAALVAITSFHVYYSQEIRMYSAFAFFSLLSVYFLFQLEKLASVRNFIIYFLVCLCFLYIHNFAAFFLIPQSLYLLYLGYATSGGKIFHLYQSRYLAGRTGAGILAVGFGGKRDHRAVAVDENLLDQWR